MLGPFNGQRGRHGEDARLRTCGRHDESGAAIRRGIAGNDVQHVAAEFLRDQIFAKKWISEKLGGNVLNIVTSYAAANCGSAFVVPSACAKAGVLAMTTSLAVEWAKHHIRLNAIAPGPFPTEGAWSRLMPSKQFEEHSKE